ncbi:Uncharacterised protein [Streptococcus pneumoniae]|nr:Uncharacterised protein [Streptococcus pneumoniae]CIV94665.1 Uncharacterised protein [Streptococcus pneumoniae]CIW24790.1 Uncharacterised protein [Streptococcus pneumoniae]CJG92888.1 Uncharacterised protein [Streptococcus pneumoniae]CJH06731.1 Uncharacterised protein [Streptococcus pneumoniae]
MTLIDFYHCWQETASNRHQTFNIGIQHGQHIQLLIVLIGSQVKSQSGVVDQDINPPYRF